MAAAATAEEAPQSSSTIKDGTVSGTLPEAEAFAVHYPGYPSSPARAVHTLGGLPAITKVHLKPPTSVASVRQHLTACSRMPRRSGTTNRPPPPTPPPRPPLRPPASSSDSAQRTPTATRPAPSTGPPLAFSFASPGPKEVVRRRVLRWWRVSMAATILKVSV
jgi:hypothetical protein